MRGVTHRAVLGAMFAAAILAGAGPETAGAATILVKPGKLDHFVITAPPTALAGEAFMVRIEPFDAHNNLITEFPGKGGVFTVSVSGGEVSPSKLKTEEFAGGAMVRVSEKKAGVLELAVTEGGAATPIAAAQVRVLPNRLDRFVVNVPREATAGEVFQARVIAQDAFGNTKDDLADIGESLGFELSGAGTAERVDKALPAFRSGEAIVSFRPVKSGKLRVAVSDAKTRSRGESAALEIRPARLDHFTLLGPKTAAAGERFTVVIAAYDAHENLVANYQSSGDTVVFRPSGPGMLVPASLQAKDFKDGQARVVFTYTKAESLRIEAREQDREPAGRSEPILITPGDPDHFRVGTPSEAVAGEGFPAEIEALDRFGNLIEDYDLRGLPVHLSTDGRGRLAPAEVSPSAFSGGKAKVTLAYNRAESFTVVAALSKEALEKLVAERKRRDAEPPVPAVGAEEAARERERQQERERERLAAEEAREQARKAREQAGRDRERAEAEKARAEAEKARAEAEKKRAEAERARAAAEKASAEKPVERRGPTPQPQPSVPGAKTIDRVTAETEPDQVLIRIATSGPVSYNASTGSRLSREWIWLEIFPARKGPGVGESVAVDSPLVGEVLVEEAGPDKVKVSLQVRAAGISYIVTQQDRAVVLKVVKTD